ncbi:ATP sulfurylase [Xanthomonas campestris pv. raphani 756C]|nr:ATP sulfurylase [Xanthomonas campestris pv. raphani 756C]
MFAHFICSREWGVGNGESQQRTRLSRPIQVQAGMERSMGACPIPESPFPIPGS